jgi:hypothetical protein
MSSHPQAWAVIGVEIDADKLRVRTKVPAFPHAYPESWDYDPTTGQKLWRVTKSESPVVKTLYNKGYEIIYSNDRSMAWVASIALRQEHNNSLTPSSLFLPKGFDLEAIREGARLALEPLGLWDEPTFGLHAILYYS